MAVASENDDTLDPVWERIKVLSTLKEIYAEKLGNAAIHFGDALDVTAVFAGKVEPYRSGRQVWYHNTRFQLVMRRTFSGSEYTADVTFGTDPEGAARYDLLAEVADMTGLTQETAVADGRTYHMLSRLDYAPSLANLTLTAILKEQELREQQAARQPTEPSSE